MKPSGAFMVVFWLVPLLAIAALEWNKDWLGFALGLWIGAWVFAGWILLAGRGWAERS